MKNAVRTLIFAGVAALMLAACGPSEADKEKAEAQARQQQQIAAETAALVLPTDLNNKAAYMDVLIMTGSLVDAFKPHAGLNPIVVKWEKAVAANGRDYAKAVPAVQAAIDAAKNVYAAGDPFLRIDTIGDQAEEEMPF